MAQMVSTQVLAHVVKTDCQFDPAHPVLYFEAVPVASDKPIYGLHVAAGCLFAPGTVVNALPYDPFLYFHGEEQSLALRAWTRGWDIFHVPAVPLYHHYVGAAGSGRPMHWSPELDAQRKAEELQRARAAEEKRRDKALLVRYPNQAMHDKERNEAIVGVENVIKAAKGRIDELASQQLRLDQEMEFYKKDPSKAPAYLRRQVEETQQSTAVQKRFIGEQEAEIRRINARFDDELLRLKPLWAAAQTGAQ